MFKTFHKRSMNNNKLVSIILPVYNGADHISESIESVLKQTYQNWELIIVDDCSTDKTPEIIENFAKSDSRIYVLHNEQNLKLPKTLNVGFAVAKGDYFTWTSDDNMYRTNAIEKMVSILEENSGIGLVYADYAVINDAGEIISEAKKAKPSEIRFYNTVGACFMYRRMLASKVGEYDPETFLAEDYDYWIRCYKYSDFLHVSENLYIYRWHNKSLSLTKRKEVKYQTQYVLEKNSEFIISKCVTKEDKNRYFSSILMLFEDRSLFSKKEIKKIREKYYKDKIFALADRKRRFKQKKQEIITKYKRRFRKVKDFLFKILKMQK